MSQASALYRLQSLDMELKSKQARLMEIRAKLGTDRPVQKAAAKAQAAKEALAPWKTRVTDLDLEIKSLTEKMKATEKRLYSGKVNNPKELQEMQQEIASLRHRRAQLEDEQLEAMVAVDSHQQAYEKAEEKLARVKRKWAAKQEAWAREETDLAREIEALEAERTTAWQALAGQSRTLYTDLRAKLGDEPIAELRDGVCERCGMRQTSHVDQQVRRGEVARCGGCGRVLVRG